MFRSFGKGKKRNDAEGKEKSRTPEKTPVKNGESKPAPSFEEMRAYLIGDASEEEMNLLWSVGYKVERVFELSFSNKQAVAWSEEEAYLILHFYYDQKALLDRMTQLLHQKGLESVL